MNDAYITYPKGYKASGIHSGCKKNMMPDIAIFMSDHLAAVAGVYTKNLVKGHSLTRSIHLINQYQQCKAICINSGSANACVGQIGFDDANALAQAIAKEVDCSSNHVLTLSTGIIGQRLHIDSMLKTVPTLCKSLSSDSESAHMAMQAIMTTDTVPKECTATLNIGDKEVRIAGIAKGSGMIHPQLATMISVITTDADINTEDLDVLLKNAVKYSFNRVSVDGDTSVCDSVIIMANKASGAQIKPGTDAFDAFQDALCLLCEDLARMIAADGEGATKTIEVSVINAHTESDAYLAVRSICLSPLVKTALYGADANWGRIMTALGYSGAHFDPEHVNICIGEILVCDNGSAVSFDEDAAKDYLSNKEIGIEVNLNAGLYNDRMWTCDFSHDYVSINGSKRS